MKTVRIMHLIAIWLVIFGISPVKATDVPLISTYQFNSEWDVHGFPELLTTADGTPLFKLDVTVAVEWQLNEAGELTTITVLEETPAGQGYADIVVNAMRKTRLEPKIDNPTAPVRVQGTFKFRNLEEKKSAAL